MSIRLAKPVGSLAARYDAVVIGSGYGGGVAASRLSRMGLKVAVLERGREWLPGEFPSSVLAAQREFRMTGAKLSIGSPTALFDLRLGDDVHVLQASGVGGTSLINANVCLVPDARVIEDHIWPEGVRTNHWLQVGFRRARDMLQPATLPAASTPLKLKALEKAAKSVSSVAERIPLHITFEETVNAAGVRQPACSECGDCLGGCNVGAKTTVHSTYLTDAVNHGAEIHTHAEVRYLESAGAEGWRITLHRLDDNAKAVPLRRVMARMVVLSAGTLGTNEILMRSRERGLKLSDRLGKRLSTNADAIAFGYNNDQRVNAIGTGSSTKRNGREPRVGPAVAGLIDLRRDRGL
ncbi:MAG TPA: GMC family oxidoreductase N-terminal domain-containing protein, partial [Hyphomicrobiaceae bacterium]|nr:GMC family oxidoreductase N-terminal domain-containing protein [Hyphomicrobiaceae bacterium]